MTPEALLLRDLALAAVAVVAAGVPAVLFARNLRRFRPPPEPVPGTPTPALSVLVPARNEEATLAGALEAILASRGVELEAIVLDDASEDATAAVAAAVAARDPRVVVEAAPPLPAGWSGKQHACWTLARLARHPRLVFVDADVRLAPDALARAAAFQEAAGAPLVTGFPRQLTGSFLERLLLPLIHWVLLGFLPMGRMRRRLDTAYGAGCGQLVVARRDAYFAAGGHAAIHASLHDGVALPRAFRRAGFATDLFDASPVASCRMYRGAGEVWRGLGKNAVEGLAAPRLIVGVSALLLAGQVLPPALAAAALLPGGWRPAPPVALLVAAACVLAWAPRWAAARRFGQSRLGALLHPLGVLALLAIQWQALARHLAGRPAAWKGRRYGGAQTKTAAGGPAAVRGR